MKTLIRVLLMGVAAMAFGCGKTSTPPTTAHGKKTDYHSHRAGHGDHETPLEARRTNQGIAKGEPHEAPGGKAHTSGDTRDRLKAEAARRKQEMTEYAAEVAEEAKDRAEDVPDLVSESEPEARRDRRPHADDEASDDDRPRRRQRHVDSDDEEVASDDRNP